ncbi:protein takeout-like [Bombyx mandarina]|uniref:Protein takeout-like n=1 Tax=Bombyx mandarina TaxID=7092 RepID=A0A6J2K5T3_BOMMA|nr:protein takeout-like [Bombyx mandarina]
MFSLQKFLLPSFLVLCVVGSGHSKKQIPGYIQICKHDPNTINECVQKSIEALKPKLAEGIPELDVPPLEPFIIPEVVASSKDRVPLQATGKNIKITGAGDFHINKLNVDLDSLILKAKVNFPKLHFDGLYKLDTQILVVPIKGEGNLLADVVNCDAELVFKGGKYQKDGLEFIKFNSLDTKIGIKDYNVKFDGLFNNDKVLGDAANDAINQNKAEFFNTFKPFLEAAVSKLLLNISNKVVDDLPFNELLPKP